MAETVVSFAVQQLAQMLEQEALLLKNFNEEFIDIIAELESIKALLKDADAKGEAERGEQVKLWLKELRHVTFDIEDIVEEYVFRHRKQQSRVGGYATCGGFISKIKCFFTTFMAQHRLATQIKGIKIRLQNISSRKERFNLVATTTSTCITVRDPRIDARYIDEANLVGMEEPRNQLIRWLLDKQELDIGMLSIFGPGGLGKTTLVRKVYENKEVERRFTYRAWITVSQTFEIKNLLIQLIRVTLNEEENAALIAQLPTWETTRLKDKLNDCFRRNRYLIVVDDLWELDAWKEIRSALPDTKCCSRVILTTRSEVVANSCQHKYTLQPLKPDHAWELFQKVAFKNNSASTQYSREQSHKFLSKCKGVPLAIVCIAGLLSTRETTEWDRIYEDSLLDHPQLSDLYTIFSLSYNDLPHHLKSCLMYCSVFPEDYSIQISRLLRLWVAEGFVNIDRRHGVNPSLTKEDVARRYLEELIARSLIQVKESYRYGRWKTCGIHDLLREFILGKASKQDFVALSVGQECEMEAYEDKVRRLSIMNKDHMSGKERMSSSSFSHVRSLFAFGEKSLFFSSIVSQILCSQIRLLKVLDSQGAPLKEIPGEVVSKLLFLRYLNLRGSSITCVPISVGKLINLESLDLRDTNLSEWPIGILELKQLRFLRLPDHGGLQCPKGIGRLSSIEKLGFVKIHGSIGKEMGMLTRLRLLKIVLTDGESAIDFSESFEKMKYLESCYIGVEHLEDKFLIRLNIKNPPPQLQRLRLDGLLDAAPRWILSLDKLTRLALWHSKLKDYHSFLEGLQLLPNLVALTLMEALDGEEMVFKTGGFPSLKNLVLMELHELKVMRIEQGALPRIHCIWLGKCEKLDEVLGIEHLTTLSRIEFQGMNPQFEDQIILYMEILATVHSGIVSAFKHRSSDDKSFYV